MGEVTAEGRSEPKHDHKTGPNLVGFIHVRIAVISARRAWPCLHENALKGNILGFDQNLIYILTKKLRRVINEL